MTNESVRHDSSCTSRCLSVEEDEQTSFWSWLRIEGLWFWFWNCFWTHSVLSRSCSAPGGSGAALQQHLHTSSCPSLPLLLLSSFLVPGENRPASSRFLRLQQSAQTDHAHTSTGWAPRWSTRTASGEERGGRSLGDKRGYSHGDGGRRRRRTSETAEETLEDLLLPHPGLGGVGVRGGEDADRGGERLNFSSALPLRQRWANLWAADPPELDHSRLLFSVPETPGRGAARGSWAPGQHSVWWWGGPYLVKVQCGGGSSEPLRWSEAML